MWKKSSKCECASECASGWVAKKDKCVCLQCVLSGLLYHVSFFFNKSLKHMCSSIHVFMIYVFIYIGFYSYKKCDCMCNYQIYKIIKSHSIKFEICTFNCWCLNISWGIQYVLRCVLLTLGLKKKLTSELIYNIIQKRAHLCLKICIYSLHFYINWEKLTAMERHTTKKLTCNWKPN